MAKPLTIGVSNVCAKSRAWLPNIGASGGKQVQARPQAHDELFHETLRPMDDSTFATNLVGIPQGSDGQPFGDIGPVASIVADRVAQQWPWSVGA